MRKLINEFRNILILELMDICVKIGGLEYVVEIEENQFLEDVENVFVWQSPVK